MTRKQFFAKHTASMQVIMQGVFGVTSAMADMRTCAERAAAADPDDPDLADTARNLDTCCACLVRLVSKLPVEMLMTIYHSTGGACPAPVTYPERPE
jgi:hypothetical protein